MSRAGARAAAAPSGRARSASSSALRMSAARRRMRSAVASRSRSVPSTAALRAEGHAADPPVRPQSCSGAACSCAPAVAGAGGCEAGRRRLYNWRPCCQAARSFARALAATCGCQGTTRQSEGPGVVRSAGKLAHMLSRCRRLPVKCQQTNRAKG